jgi:hypothetical protein
MLQSNAIIFIATCAICLLAPVAPYDSIHSNQHGFRLEEDVHVHLLSMVSIPEVIATAGGKSSKADPESPDPGSKGSKSTTRPTNRPAGPLPTDNNQDENTNDETNGKSSKTSPKTPKEDSGSKSGKDKSKTTRPTKKPTRSPSTSPTAWTICSSVSCEANNSCDLVDG